MQIQEIMTRDVDLIDPNATIREAALKMRTDNIGALPVGENNRLIGIVTDRDLTVRGLAEERILENTTVREVMSESVIYCYEDDDANDVAEMMAKHQVRRLPVINRDKRLVGIVALADLARRNGQSAGHALKGISNVSDGSRQI